MGEARVIRGLAPVAAVLALAACADGPGAGAAAPVVTPAAARTYPEPTYTTPHAVDGVTGASPAAVQAPAPAPAGPPDTCGAAALAGLVGKARTEIPIPADLTHRRVVCSTCPVTQDYDPARQTITYDGATGLVTKVSCG